MNQITRCPNCSTSFRVTDDQLAAHQGKVRCGRCSFIFNARDFLQRFDASSVGIAPQGNPDKAQPEIHHKIVSSSEVEAVIAESSKAIEHVISAPQSVQTVERKAEQIEAAFPFIEPTPPTPSAERDDKELKRALARLIKKNRKEKTQKTRKPSRHTIAVAEQDTVPDWSAQTAESINNNDVQNSEAEYQPILDDTDDLFLPPKRSRWHWLWALGSVLLAITLLAQLAYNFRLELSQEFPALRPKWQALCVPLQCDMPLPTQAQLLRSEWSELTYIPDHPTLIQVKATVRNLAPFEQALPKLELTLTDEAEHVLAKKVFSPKEYLALDESAQTSLQASEELHAFLQLDLGSLNSTGYSLYWFYD